MILQVAAVPVQATRHAQELETADERHRQRLTEVQAESQVCVIPYRQSNVSYRVMPCQWWGRHALPRALHSNVFNCRYWQSKESQSWMT